MSNILLPDDDPDASADAEADAVVPERLVKCQACGAFLPEDAQAWHFRSDHHERWLRLLRWLRGTDVKLAKALEPALEGMIGHWAGKDRTT